MSLPVGGKIGVGSDLLHQPLLETLDLRLELVLGLAGELPAMAVRYKERERLDEPAHADLIGGEGTNGHCEAPTVDRRFLGQDVAVESQPVGQFDILDTGPFEPQAPVLLGRIDIEQLMLLEIGRRL